MRGVALALFLLAGCVAPATHDATASPATIRFGDAVRLPQVEAGADPILSAAPDGALWVAAIGGRTEQPNAVQGSSWLWRSQDDGVSWTTLRGPVRTLGLPNQAGTTWGSHDMDLAIGTDGRVYSAAWWVPRAPVIPPAPLPNPTAGQLPGNFLVEASTDDGASWTGNSFPAPEGTTLSDGPRLAAGLAGTAWLKYSVRRAGLEPNPAGGDPVDAVTQSLESRVLRSDDGGASWTFQGIVQDSPLLHPAPRSEGWMKWIGNETLVVPYAEYPQGDPPMPRQAGLARSTDGGRTWLQHPIAEVEGFFQLIPVQVAVGPGGHLLASYAALLDGHLQLHVSESADEGVSWSTPQVIRSTGTSFAARPVVAGDGRAAVAFYGSDWEGTGTEAPNGTAWHVFVAIREPGAATWQVVQATHDPVKTGAICTAGLACGNAALYGAYDWLGVDALPDGRLAVAYSQGPTPEEPFTVTHVSVESGTSR